MIFTRLLSAPTRTLLLIHSSFSPSVNVSTESPPCSINRCLFWTRRAGSHCISKQQRLRLSFLSKNIRGTLEPELSARRCAAPTVGLKARVPLSLNISRTYFDRLRAKGAEGVAIRFSRGFEAGRQRAADPWPAISFGCCDTEDEDCFVCEGVRASRSLEMGGFITATRRY